MPPLPLGSPARLMYRGSEKAMPICPVCRENFPDGMSTCPADGQPLLPDDVAMMNADLAEGQMVGEYRIEHKLGEGGFGSVYRAVHPLIGKAAAIKVLNRQFSANPEIVSRFIAEARAVNQIRHRHIIDIFSFGKLDDGRQYYVMELLEGMTLDAYIKQQGRLSPEQAIAILQKLARALDAAHATGIAHRDLKPENIFLAFDDEGAPFPKLLDFGIAKLLGDSAGGHKTRTGAPIGTPYYMSPEQCRGKNVDHRTDIYSFGAVVHEMLTGRQPFDGEDVMDLMMKQLSQAPPRVSSVCSALPKDLDGPVLQMLEKDPAKRPPTLVAATDALADAARRAGFAVPSTGSRPAAAAAMPAGSMAAGGHRTPGAITPEPMRGLADARTVPLESAATTLLTAESASKRASGRLGIAIGVAGALVVLGVGALVVLRPAKNQAPPVEATQPPATMPPVAVSHTAGAPAAVPAPPQVAAVSTVALTIQSTPKGVEVYRDKEKLGVTPGPFVMTKGEKVKLTFRAPGFVPEDREIDTSSDSPISIELRKVAPARTGRTNQDLENPFQ
jgi:eukaryotic-like serine/threonine-protein kinase